jgi:NADH-quinone oxidoreductase subunit J
MDSVREFLQRDWPLLLPVVLGFLAVYWLLPSARASWKLPGVFAGAAGLVCAGWFLIHRDFIPVEGLLFYAFSGIAILGAGLMLAQKNPVRAALSFALVVISSCGLFLLLGAPCLMAATGIIYAGAIVITFLFVVMLAQQSGLTSADQRSREPFLVSVAGFVLLAGLVVVLHRNFETQPVDEEIGILLDHFQRVAAAGTFEDIKSIVRDPAVQKKDQWSLALVDRLGEIVTKDKKATFDKFESFFVERDTTQLKELSGEIVTELRDMRFRQSGLRPDSKLKLSPFAGVPANGPLPGSAERLPARNVAALGRTLFTDHLVAVELAGVLLLVATIGAIVISRPAPVPPIGSDGAVILREGELR